MPAGHLIRGARGEAAAEAEMAERGFTVLDRNWRCPAGEIDLVCRDGDAIVFVEVKTRDASGLQRPFEALSPAKKAKLVAAACRYLSVKNLWDKPCRFDLASVEAMGQGFQVRVYTDVIDAGLLASRGGWQPW